MPAVGNWKKPFDAALQMVRDSKTATYKLCAEQILQLARTDGIIQDPSATHRIQGKSGKPFLLFRETSQMNRWTKKRKKPRKVFHQTKFVSRTGELAKSLNMSAVKIETKGGDPSAVRFHFTGRTADILRGGDAKAGRGKPTVEITDKEGKVHLQTERGRRRPIELASRKVARFFPKTMKTELDKRARSLSK
ncbi:MAG: hypothetical protein LBU89_07610 [Fibromonadaceae bacterium]|jgi:hypothetical protein|nr:hypothetical protein [Fibromonadaceae bacterium]